MMAKVRRGSASVTLAPFASCTDTAPRPARRGAGGPVAPWPPVPAPNFARKPVGSASGAPGREYRECQTRRVAFSATRALLGGYAFRSGGGRAGLVYHGLHPP